MNGKISFGVDFLHAMLEANEQSRISRGDTLSIARMLLIVEWGLSTEEQDEANQLLWKKINEESLDVFYDAVTRLVEHVKDVQEARSKLLADLILITMLDGDVNDDERGFIEAFGTMLDLRPSEISEIAKRADDLLNALVWFANNNHMKE